MVINYIIIFILYTTTPIGSRCRKLLMKIFQYPFYECKLFIENISSYYPGIYFNNKFYNKNIKNDFYFLNKIKI
jgi:hypothetical protein